VEYLFSTGGILDFRRRKSRIPDLPFDHEVDGVEVGPPLPASRNFNQRTALKLLDEAVDARNAHADILGEAVLAGKTKVVVPGVAEKQRVDRLCADRNVGIAQNEIRDLGEPIASHRVCGVELHVALKALNLTAYVFHVAIIRSARGATAVIPVPVDCRLARTIVQGEASTSFAGPKSGGWSLALVR